MRTPLKLAPLGRSARAHVRALCTWWRALSRGSRWGARALLALPATYLAYLVVMNAILMTGSLESLVNGRQDNVRVSAGRAWTVWFGAVHARDLQIVIQEDDIEVSVFFPRAEATLHSWELAGLVFHARKIRGSGGTLAIRRRVPMAEATEERLAGLPVIPGLPSPIIPAAPPGDTDFSNNWTIHMEDIDTHFDTIWIDNYRLDGAIHARGAYEWAAAQWVRLDRVGIAIGGGRLEIAGRAVAEAITADLALSSDRLAQSPPAPLGELLDRTRALGHLTARVSEPAALDWFVPADVPLRFEGGAADIDFAGALVDGTLSLGTRADVVLEDFALGWEEGHVATSGRLTAEVDPTATTGLIDLESTVRWGADRTAEPIATIGTARARLRWRDRAVETLATVPASDVLVEVDTPDLRSLAEVGGIAPGLLTGSAHWRLETLLGPAGTGTSRIEARASRLSMAFAELAYHCGIVATAKLNHEAPLRAEGSGKLVIAELSTKEGRDEWESSSWTAQLELYRLAFDLEGEPSFTVAARGKADDADPILDLPPLDEAVPDVPLALVDLEDLKVDAGVFSFGDRVELQVYEASTDGLSIRGRMLAQNGHRSGKFLVDAPLVTFGIDVATSGVTVVTNPARDWGSLHLAELDR